MIASKTAPKPIVLCILDGWGEGAHTADNAILEANTPIWDALNNRYPHSSLATSGLAVGLPEGQMGNSEVGHMNIGSGRVVMQSLPRIDQAIADGSLVQMAPMRKFMEKIREEGGDVHLLGLLSPGGVHSHQAHIAQLAKNIADRGVQVNVHVFLDGRDTPPASALEYLTDFKRAISGYDKIKIVTACGRYYGMDRDNRWDRVKLAYDAMVSGIGTKTASIEEAVQASYDKNIFDEFITPIVLEGYEGMQDGDGLLMANFRADRARQTLDALTDPAFAGFARNKTVAFAAKLGMVEYSTELSRVVDVLFPSEELHNILGEVVAAKGLKQLRIAETEKYAHVTFFFNGGREEKFDGESRTMIASPNVATYDLQPEMSAVQVTDALVQAIEGGQFDLIVANYANTDMVGHTGIQAAAVQAVETIDKCLGRLLASVEKTGGVLFITADHGNSEQMLDPETGQPHTAHTTNPVPLVAAGASMEGRKLKNGRLCDIAPTILEVMNIAQPSEMTGVSLIHG